MNYKQQHTKPDAYTRNVKYLCRQIDELEAENESPTTEIIITINEEN